MILTHVPIFDFIFHYTYLFKLFNLMSDKNKTTYSRSNIVRYYKQLGLLQPAEKTILELFRDRLPTMKMLDIGIGGGRTTQYFGTLTAEYIGIDYSTEMIAACQQRFAPSPQSMSLKVVDARDMSQFDDNYFDFILFSFNGIDYVSHSDRLKVFQEIQRVGKSGCYFFFSSHNLQGIAKEFDFKQQISLNVLKTYINLVMLALLKLFNPSVNRKKLKTCDYLIIKDESHNFFLQTYYVRPTEQIKQLTPNFSNIEIYSWKTGEKILDLDNLSSNSDMWLYYLCVIN